LTVEAIRKLIPESFKGPLLGAVLFGRRVICASSSRLPDFTLIDAQRYGTTPLYNYLTGHPDVEPTLVKEVHHFDINYSKGLKYRMTGEA
jgi:hypothetical protein